MLVSATVEGQVKVWDITDLNAVKCLHTFNAHRNDVPLRSSYNNISVAFLDDTTFVTRFLADNSIKMWDVTYPGQATCVHTITVSGSMVSTLAVVPLQCLGQADSKVLVAGCSDKLMMWQVEHQGIPKAREPIFVDKELASTNVRQVTTLSVLKDEERLISGHVDGSMTVWDTQDAGNITEIMTIKGHADIINACVLS